VGGGLETVVFDIICVVNNIVKNYNKIWMRGIEITQD
jgi:hypothetical protein